jgi:hypothetical protein
MADRPTVGRVAFGPAPVCARVVANRINQKPDMHRIRDRWFG